VCLPAVSLTEVPTVHQLELVGGQTHHRSNSVCVRSFTTQCQMLVLLCVRVAVCACCQCRAPHPRTRAHSYPATAAQASSRWSHGVQHIPRRPTLVAGDCGVGRVSSTVLEALPNVCQGTSDGGSAWQQWPVLFSTLGAFACACKMAVGRCGHLLTAKPASTGLCGQDLLIAFDQRCSKFLVRGPDYLKNSLKFF